MKSFSQKASETTNSELPSGTYSKVKINEEAIEYVQDPEATCQVSHRRELYP